MFNRLIYYCLMGLFAHCIKASSKVFYIFYQLKFIAGIFSETLKLHINIFYIAAF